MCAKTVEHPSNQGPPNVTVQKLCGQPGIAAQLALEMERSSSEQALFAYAGKAAKFCGAWDCAHASRRRDRYSGAE